MSPHPCRSANRCSTLQCPACAWRYCRHVAIRILNQSTGPFHTIALTISDPSPEGFRAFRVALRNCTDHLRRSFRHWHPFGIVVWLQRDGTIKGLVSLGLLGLDDAAKGLERWSPKLAVEVSPEELRVAIWHVTKPSAIWSGPSGGRRYQSIRFSIWPHRDQHSAPPPWSLPESVGYLYDPMPVLI